MLSSTERAQTVYLQSRQLNIRLLSQQDFTLKSALQHAQITFNSSDEQKTLYLIHRDRVCKKWDNIISKINNSFANLEMSALKKISAGVIYEKYR